MRSIWFRTLLGLVAALVWGGVVVRALKRPDEEFVRPQPTNGQDTVTRQVEVWNPVVLDDDPFLRNAPRSGSTTTEVRKPAPRSAASVRVTSTPPPVPKEPLPWPTLKYEGMMRSGSNGTMVALLSMNGRSRVVPVGNTVDDLQVEQADPDSLKVRWQGQSRWVTRQ
ncbi:MAG: hypothetical protein JNL52_10890 [Flavobacteriales bacterium]|nr:hypothetical protein [Flavobacteriales bacterium]